MRFAFALYRYFPHGGLQCDMLRIAREAAQRGHEVCIFVCEWLGGLPEEPGIRICRIPAAGLTNPAKMASFGRRFLQEKRRCGPFDAAVTFNRVPGGDFYFAADNCLAVEWREKYAPWRLKFLPRYRAFLKQEAELCRAPDCRIFCITPRQKLQYRQAYGLPEKSFFALPPGMDPRCRRPENAEEIRRNTRQKLGLAEQQTMLILVGSDFRRKGGDRALRAVAALPDEMRKEVRFFLVGDRAPGDCGKLAEKLGLAGQTVFTGGRSDVPELLLAADLMIHPARSESAGSVLIEALAAGLPVLASGVCGFAPYVAAADPALVIPEPFEQEALNGLLRDALTRLDALKERTCAYGAAADFCRRAVVAVDELERFVRAKAR